MAKICCCISLSTAGFVIGILNLTALIILMFYVILLTTILDMVKEIDDMTLVGIVTPFIVCIVVCLILLFGIITKRAVLLLPWLTLFIIYEIIMTVQTVNAIRNTYLYGDWDVLLLVISLRDVELFSFHVIYSLYKELKASSGIKSYQARV